LSKYRLLERHDYATNPTRTPDGDIISQKRTAERKMQGLEILAGKSTEKIIAAKQGQRLHSRNIKRVLLQRRNA
jgi:hypothetical protein